MYLLRNNPKGLGAEPTSNHPADNRSLFVSLLYLDFEIKSYLAGEMRPGVARKVVAKEIEV